MNNVSLKHLNTFRIDATAPIYYNIFSEQDVFMALSLGEGPFFVLGGGSNILFKNPINRTVLKNNIKGIDIIDEDEERLLVEVGAGENWHQFVMWSINHGLYGLENLSLIPGSVGAAPIQNIGAYGVEQEATFHSLKAINLEDGQTYVYYKNECGFGYRDSIFKSKLKGKIIITRVRYLLNKTGLLSTSYGAIQEELTKLNKPLEAINQVDISNAVINIRQSKLPDPYFYPNSGSFFKNPIISAELHEHLKEKFPDLVSYEYDDNHYKLAAGWLIEKCGFKGKVINGVSSFKNQALVLVKLDDNASGIDIWNYANKIIKTVKKTFDVDLEPEVNIL